MIWKCSQELNADLKRPSTKAVSKRDIGLLAYIPPTKRSATSPFKYDTSWEQFFREDALREHRRGTFGISNLGVWSSPVEPTHWSLAALEFTQSSGPISSWIDMAMVTVQGGPLSIALTYENRTTSTEDVAQLLTCLDRVLLALIN